MKTMVKIGAAIGALLLLVSFFAQGAPQQSALAAMACAFCIIPYVVFRVDQITLDQASSKKFRDKVLDDIEDLKPKA